MMIKFLYFSFTLLVFANSYAQKFVIQKKEDSTRVSNTGSREVLVNVDGDLLVESYINVKDIIPQNSRVIKDENGNEIILDPLLLVRSNESNPPGELKMLDISKRLVGPVNKFFVTLSNVKGDQVLKLNTNLPTERYVVAISDAVFSEAVSEAKSINSKRHYGTYSTEVTKVKVEYTFDRKQCTETVDSNNQIVKNCSLVPGSKVKKEVELYAVDLDFKGTDTYDNKKGTWTFSLVVYEKALLKQWPDITSSVSFVDNKPTGASNATPNGFIKTPTATPPTVPPTNSNK